VEALGGGLHVHRGTCNTYVLVRDGRAIVVDPGDGGVLDELSEVGAESVEWALHTHHHREACQGTHRLVEHGAHVAVPSAEADRFTDAEGWWQRVQIDDRYDCANVFSGPVASVPVARALDDYERFAWNGLSFLVLPTPGHTRGSVTYVVEVEGRRIAFSGDLIHSPGRVWTIHDLHWDYSNPDGLNAAVHSARALSDTEPDLLAPAHGEPMDDCAAALAELEANLRRLHAVAGRRYVGDVDVPIAADLRLARVTDSLVQVTSAFAHFTVLMAADGRALLFDYGFATPDHLAGAEVRFVEHSLRELEREIGLKSVEVVVPTHYHDDHVSGIAFLRERYGCEVWAFEGFADLLRRPHAYRLPAVWRDPVPVTRTFAEGETIEWEGHAFVAHRVPGHTPHAVALFGTVDGHRVGITGDEIQLDGAGEPRGGGPVYRNGYRAGFFAEGIETVAAHRPEVILTGHDGPIELDEQRIAALRGWAEELERAHAALASFPAAVDQCLDTDVVRVDPYRLSGRPGSPLEFELTVANHFPDELLVELRIEAPEGWRVDPPAWRQMVPAGSTGVAAASLVPPVDAPTRVRLAIPLSAVLGGLRLGQVTEVLVTLE
jgi:glyoxylase-like metal-dependent hydrolase (beta-lactamase superfamily II)